MAKNILVVGGAGYIGGALTDLLLESSYNFRVYDSLVYEVEYRKPVELCTGDVRDVDRLIPNLEWADIVIWLVAIVGDGACAADSELTVEINEKKVKWLADNYDGRIIFLSTCSVYGANDGILDEESELNPLSLYAETKLKAETLLSASHAMIFRLGTLYGVGDVFSRIRMDLVVNTLTAKAFHYNKVSVFGGDQYRPLLHVRDVAGAILASIETDCTGIYNLHSKNMRIIDLAEQVKEHFPDLEIQKTDVEFQDNRNYRVSSQKAEDAFSFNPTHTVDGGIEEIKTLLAEGRIKHVNSPRYSNANFIKGLVEVTKTPLGYEVSRKI
jgi:nucleoside-diphosphate-sugar epimerase